MPKKTCYKFNYDWFFGVGKYASGRTLKEVKEMENKKTREEWKKEKPVVKIRLPYTYGQLRKAMGKWIDFAEIDEEANINQFIKDHLIPGIETYALTDEFLEKEVISYHQSH